MLVGGVGAGCTHSHTTSGMEQGGGKARVARELLSEMERFAGVVVLAVSTTQKTEKLRLCIHRLHPHFIAKIKFKL